MVLQQIRLREFLLFQPDAGKRRHLHADFLLLPDELRVRVAETVAHRYVLFLHRLICHMQADTLFHRIRSGVQIRILRKQSLLAARQQHRREEAPLKIMQRLPASKVINRRPGRHRPAVIQLPYNSSHTLAAVTPPVLHRIAHCLRLQKLGSVHKVGQILRIAEILRHIDHHLRIAVLAALMAVHHIREDVAVFRQRKALYRLQRRKRLKAKLRGIAEVVPAVIRERLIAVPYLPVMGVSSGFRLRLVEIPAGRRAGRPVKSVRVLPFHDSGNHIAVHARIIANQMRVARIAVHNHALHLVVPAPQSQTGVMADTADVFRNLLRNVFFKFLRKTVGGAGEHQILPHQKAVLVAQIKKPVLRVARAAPDADSIVIRLRALRQQPLCALPGKPRQQTVLRNIVRAHRKNRYAVDLVGKALSPRIFVNLHTQRAQTDPALPHILHRAVRQRLHAHRIERLSAVASRPPQRRLLYHKLPRRIVPPLHASIRRRHHYPVRHLPACAAAQRIHIKRQAYLSFHMFLADEHAVNTLIANAQQRYRAENPHIRQLWRPVPAGHAARFSQIVKAVQRIRIAWNGALLSHLLLHITDWRIKAHLQAVIALP